MSAHSNHPPLVFKNIPSGIERSLYDNSANEDIFKEAIPSYQAELDRCGLNNRPDYKPTNGLHRTKNSRKHRVTWFNTPYSMDVETNVGKEFLKLIDFHFPPGNILHSVLNRTTVKVS